jgi:tRNA nucleotidyltransferase (CCA-adding enzyme)
MKRVDELRPGPGEREKELALAAEIIAEIGKHGREAMLVGSIAKNTCLRGDKDLDIFVLFDKAVPRKELEREGLAIGKAVAKAFKAKAGVHYAEHPYTRMVIKSYDIDVVPCYRLAMGERIISAVDRSPLHTEYILSRLEKPNEVRLLKHFCKRIGVYGAEIATHGFSGYLCELLVLKYGSFQRVLEEATNWKRGHHIDVEAHAKRQFSDPLVVIDPVDPERNVAAAVSEQKLCEFILLAREYLKTRRLPVKAALMPNRGRLLAVEWSIGEENEEIIWSQLERFQEKVVAQLRAAEFGVIDSEIWTDSLAKAQLLLELEVWELPKVNDHGGPSVYNYKHAENFIRKYRKAVVRGDRLVTERRREYPTAKSLLKTLLAEPPTHLKGRRFRVLEGAAARKTRAWRGYSQKFWKLTA